jgi:MoaA/NifB/PqqE/SkfB family radical SAM enzyme
MLHWWEPYPSYIEIEVTTRCNLRCILCERTYWDEPNKDMSFEEFKMIGDQFPRLKWIGLTGIGESFINKDFIKMLRYVKERNIFVEIYDTFFFIDEKISNELIDLGIDIIFVSLDAATKETYEKIRVGSNFERVINNIQTFIKLRRERKAAFPRLHFHFVVNKLNYHEIPQYIELIDSFSKEEKFRIQFSRMLHEFEQTKGFFMEVPEKIIQDTEFKARDKGIPVIWNLDIHTSKKPVYRCVEWTMPFIFVTGHVIPCCSGNEAGKRDFQKRTALGNIFEQNFKDIWNGEKYKQLRRSLKKGKVPLQCKNCCLYKV